MSRPDPAVSLAHAVATRPGVYAVLLGSGVSRPAGIPTGWEVVEELLRRLRAMHGANPGEDLGAWYESTYGVPPTYSGVVATLGLTPGDRRAVISGMIDPPGNRREPTEAHRAIARLAAGGHLQVILTTNFDPLMERALDELRVTYEVLATTDAIENAAPLHQYGMPIIVKLHRDWLDERMLNTVAELQTYDPPVDRLLDRVLDDHGLIVAGWSATWDPALRNAFGRARIRNHAATYWVEPRTPSPDAESLIRSRQAELITRSADNLFSDVADKVEALVATTASVHPLDTSMAVAQLKLRLADPARTIQARDQVMAEARRLSEAVGDETHYPVRSIAVDEAVLLDRAISYENAARTMALLLAHGTTYGSSTLNPVWGQALELVANPRADWGGDTALLYLRGYPALVCMYAGGVAAVAVNNYPALNALFRGGTWHHPNQEVPLVMGINADRVMATSGRAPHWLHPGGPPYYAPASKHLQEVTTNLLEELVPSATRSQEAFDRFEALLGLVHTHLTSGEVFGEAALAWGPVGEFAYRQRYLFGTPLLTTMAEELHGAGDDWPPLAAGLFGNAHPYDMAQQAMRRYSKLVESARRP